MVHTMQRGGDIFIAQNTPAPKIEVIKEAVFMVDIMPDIYYPHFEIF